jgi:hypothetical protein
MPPLFNQKVTQVLPGLGGQPSQYTEMSLFEMPADTLTAVASGTQTTALLFTAVQNRVTVVASAGDAVRLPPALAGLAITVSNAASNAMNVFPSSAAQGGVTGGDAINALSQNTAYSQATGRQTFRCFTTGTWETA